MQRTMLLHLKEKFDHHLGRGANQHLSPTTLLGIGNGLEAISQYGHAHHLKERDLR